MNYLKPNTHERTVFAYDEIAEKKPLAFAFNLVGNPLFYLTQVAVCTEDLKQ